MEESSLPKKRVSRGKSRTGCLNCKKRRKKCDEGKPQCWECVKYGHVCQYSQTPRVAGRNILPKPKDTAHHALILPRMTGQPSKVIAQPKNTVFSDDLEYRYFQLFRNASTSQFAGCFDCPIWSHLILQAAEHEKTLRQAMVAIGAVYATLDKTELSRNSPKTGFSDQHHLFAIRTYGKTVNQIRNAITESTYDLRSTVFSCLLMVCFESLHSNFRMSVIQMESGLRLLDQWTKIKNNGASTSPPSFKSRSAAQGYSRDNIEMELVWMFENLNLQTTRYMEMTSVRYPELRKIRLPDLSSYGKQFSSLTDARGSLSSIRSKILDFSSSSPFLLSDPGLVNPGIDALKKHGRTEDDQSIKMDCDKALRRWHNAASHLIERNLKSRNTKAYLGAVSLQVSWIILKVILDCSLDDEMSYDTYLEEFKEIIRLARILVVHFCPQTWFSCDLAHVHALFFTRMKCRDNELRKEAMTLFAENMAKSDPEGTWKRSLSGIILASVLQIEEEGRIDGFIPIEKRVSNARTNFKPKVESGIIEFRLADGQVIQRQVQGHGRAEGVLEPCVIKACSTHSLERLNMPGEVHNSFLDRTDLW